MSKSSDTEQDAADAVVATYRAATAAASAARVIADAAQAKAWKAEADYEAAIVAKDEAFEAAANVYLGPQQEDEE